MSAMTAEKLSLGVSRLRATTAPISLQQGTMSSKECSLMLWCPYSCTCAQTCSLLGWRHTSGSCDGHKTLRCHLSYSSMWDSWKWDCLDSWALDNRRHTHTNHTLACLLHLASIIQSTPSKHAERAGCFRQVAVPPYTGPP